MPRESQRYSGVVPEGLLNDHEPERQPERMLFCGWRRDMADMIDELDLDVPPGSELWLFNGVPMEERAMRLLDKGQKSALRLRNVTVRHVVGNPVIRRQLLSLTEVSDGLQGDGLEAGQRTGRRETLNYFTSILILSDCSEEEVDAVASDSRSIATTLMIQVILCTRPSQYE
jgi:ion channel POLLUX/CASTOR